MKRTNSSARWINEHVNDFYVKQAKKEGYRSRAAYKLLEIDQKDRLFKPGMVVVDLGATPGGWSAVAKQKVGAQGQVFALDILPMAPLAGVEFVQGDFNDEAVVEKLTQHVGKVDIVISDIAPNITGIATVDQARAFQLNEQALAFATDVLKPGGTFLVKVFQGSGFEAFLKTMRESFTKVQSRKPKSSRDRSQEVYILGIGFRR